MIKMQYLTITAVRTLNDRKIEYQVEAAGSTDPFTMELFSDEIKKQAGTYERLPMEQFLAELDLPLLTQPGHNETFHVRVGTDVSMRDPQHIWGLLSPSAEAPTAAAARRQLQDRISGQTLVINPMLPSRQEIKVPDLNGQHKPPQPDPPLQADS